MGIKIKLRREGQKRVPTYKVVVLQSKRGIRAKPIEIVGFLRLQEGFPCSKAYLVLNFDRLAYWVAKGAKLTKRLEKVLIRN